MATFTHRVRLHFRGLSLTQIPFATLLKSAELPAEYKAYSDKINALNASRTIKP